MPGLLCGEGPSSGQGSFAGGFSRVSLPARRATQKISIQCVRAIAHVAPDGWNSKMRGPCECCAMQHGTNESDKAVNFSLDSCLSSPLISPGVFFRVSPRSPKKAFTRPVKCSTSNQEMKEVQSEKSATCSAENECIKSEMETKPRQQAACASAPAACPMPCLSRRIDSSPSPNLPGHGARQRS